MRRSVQIAFGVFVLMTEAKVGSTGAAPAANSVLPRATAAETVVVRATQGGRWGKVRSLIAQMTIGVPDGAPEYTLGEVGAIAVGPTGLVYILDDGPTIREYAGDGRYRRDIGRVGSGPGEYRRPDGPALNAIADGRLVVRDPPNGRLVVFSPDGSSVTWPLSGRAVGRPIFSDTAGIVLAPVLLSQSARNLDQWFGLVRFGRNGRMLDTVMAPRWKFDRPFLLADNASGSSIRDIPYAPEPIWTYSPLGYFVGGVSSVYRIDLYRNARSVLRIERATPPVPVSAEEAKDHAATIIESLRRRNPGWRWNGPPVPRIKPAFRDIFTGQDGRIWVVTSQPSSKGALPDGARSNGRLDQRWREPIVFDVFMPNGEFIGAVAAPEGLALDPVPVFRGDSVWAVFEDTEGVRYLKRYLATPR